MRYSDTNEVCGYRIVWMQQLVQLPVWFEQTGYLIHHVQFESKGGLFGLNAYSTIYCI